MILIKKIFFSIQFLCFLPGYAGFATGTLVRTINGFTPIENIRTNDIIVCCDENYNIVAKPVLFIYKKFISSHIRVYYNDMYLIVSNDQLFYNAKYNKWVNVNSLCINDFLYGSDRRAYVIHHIEYSNEPIELYCLYVKDYHNFCVTSSEIIVHNFIPIVLGAAWIFGAGGIELTSFGIGFFGGTLIGYSLYKKRQYEQKHKIVVFESGMFPGDPNDDDELKQKEKKRKRDEARSEHKPLTNKEARAKAKKLGYIEVKDHPAAVPQNSLVFKKGDKFISPDRTGHKGGIWKMFNRRGERISTWNIDLIRKIGK